MVGSQSIPDLVTAAQANALASTDRLALEGIAIDIFTVFEARMQHHFKRGPFSRKLSAMLQAEGQASLSKRVHQYYLAINVLKHGKGASYRELLGTKNCPFVVKSNSEVIKDEAHPSLVDVTAIGFFDGLTTTILEAHDFLENR